MKTKSYDAVIVGAGPAGIGIGVMLKEVGVKNFIILEKGGIGESFLRWPVEMRLITPSFTSNFFGSLDLNAITSDTSPAFTLRTEHPSGLEYARYLNAVADHYHLPVQTETWVISMRKTEKGFLLSTVEGQIEARYVIWAAGEYQYPRLKVFPGSEECLHSSEVSTWKEVKDDDIVIIGGFESGIDAAIHLEALGKRVTVLDPQELWKDRISDPSRGLSPYTFQRLQSALKNERIKLRGGSSVKKVEKVNEGWRVSLSKGRPMVTPSRPVLAAGFDGAISVIPELFSYAENGAALLTADDESQITEGLFLAGPQVRHGDLIFCFIYKFRLRFGVVANAVGTRLGFSTEKLERYRKEGLFLEDLSCCGNECSC